MMSAKTAATIAAAFAGVAAARAEGSQAGTREDVELLLAAHGAVWAALHPDQTAAEAGNGLAFGRDLPGGPGLYTPLDARLALWRTADKCLELFAERVRRDGAV